MSFKKFRANGFDKALTVEEQQIKITEVRKLIGPLVNKMPNLFSDVSISRYLRARNWNTKKASKMLKETVKWRLENKPETIRWGDIAHEAETGKIYRTNYLDKFGRTVLVMRPGFQNTSSTKEQIRYLVYCMENAILNSAAGQEEMVWLIDFQGWSASSITMNATRETAHVLQEHYPERLGLGILYNPPKIFESFWTMVKPFLEPKTHKKVKFVYSNNNDSQKIMQELFDMDKLESAFGGCNLKEFNYEEYEEQMKEDDKKMSNLLNSGESVLLQQPSISSVFQRSKSSISAPLSESSDEASRSSDVASPELEEIAIQSGNERKGQESYNAISTAKSQANAI